MLAPSLQQFSLRTEMLPSYIPVRVAEKILFVGESVQMFENHTHGPSRAGSRASSPHELAVFIISSQVQMFLTAGPR